MEKIIDDVLHARLRKKWKFRHLGKRTVQQYEHEIKLLNEGKTDLSMYSPSTARKRLFLWRLFLGEGHELCKDLVIRVPRKEPNFLSEQEVESLFSVARDRREKLILALGILMGLRVAEMKALNQDAISDDYNFLRIHRKGAWTQQLPIPESVVQYLPKKHFTETDRNKNLLNISIRRIQEVVKELGDRAGIKRRITPHALRHTFATRMSSKGVPLYHLKELMGHRSIQTTERYLHVQPEHLRDSINK